MESYNQGYKDEKLEEIANKVRKNTSKLENIKDNVERNKLSDIITKDSDYLAKYLKDTYPNSFKVFNYTKNEQIPEIKVDSTSLSEAPQELINLWKEIRSTINPKVHDVVYASTYYKSPYEKNELINRKWAFFVDEDDIYITRTYRNMDIMPNQFYDFLEKMGLGLNMDKYIYRGVNYEIRNDKWPLKVKKLNKI